jgi:hypothetical protein
MTKGSILYSVLRLSGDWDPIYRKYLSYIFLDKNYAKSATLDHQSMHFANFKNKTSKNHT